MGAGLGGLAMPTASTTTGAVVRAAPDEAKTMRGTGAAPAWRGSEAGAAGCSWHAACVASPPSVALAAPGEAGRVAMAALAGGWAASAGTAVPLPPPPCRGVVCGTAMAGAHCTATAGAGGAAYVT